MSSMDDAGGRGSEDHQVVLILSPRKLNAGFSLNFSVQEVKDIFLLSRILNLKFQLIATVIYCGDVDVRTRGAV